MREMEAYSAYLYRLVEPVLGDRVWEVGMGHGQYTARMREAGKRVLATDVDPRCLDAARRAWAGDDLIVIDRVDLREEASIRAHTAYAAESILCVNVLEHIEDDVGALRWLRESAAPRAALALIVPAMPELYGRMDAEAGHFRRYSRRSLTTLLDTAGWRPHAVRYVNFLGAVGWWYHNRVRRSAGLGDVRANRAMRAVDRWLPRVAWWTDPVLGSLAGLSVLAVGRSGDG